MQVLEHIFMYSGPHYTSGMWRRLAMQSARGERHADMRHCSHSSARVREPCLPFEKTTERNSTATAYSKTYPVILLGPAGPRMSAIAAPMDQPPCRLLAVSRDWVGAAHGVTGPALPDQRINIKPGFRPALSCRYFAR